MASEYKQKQTETTTGTDDVQVRFDELVLISTSPEVLNSSSN